MQAREFLLAACAGILLWPAAAEAQSVRITLTDALARAREQAPRVVSARLSVEEARGRLLGASTRFQNNPELDVAVGQRRGDTSSTDVEFGIQQVLEPSGRRSARTDAATEGVVQSTAAIADTSRLVLEATASSFMHAVHAGELVNLLSAAEELAAQVHNAADRRFKAGDIAVLDVNIARASLARARSQHQSALAMQMAAVGELKELLGIEGDVIIDGRLDAGEPVDNAAMLSAAAERPEIRQLESALREAEAEARLAKTYQKPEVGLSARYEREEGDNVLLGGVTIGFPVFARGQELFAVSTARARRLASDLEAARQRVRIQVQTAAADYRLRVAAVRVLQDEALPGLDENDRLITRSFEVGQLGLTDLLLIRRETLETRFQYLDTLLEASLARIQLQSKAGVLR